MPNLRPGCKSLEEWNIRLEDHSPPSLLALHHAERKRKHK